MKYNFDWLLALTNRDLDCGFVDAKQKTFYCQSINVINLFLPYLESEVSIWP